MHEIKNSVTCGDSLVLTKNLPDGSIDGIVIDPPYGEGFDYANDDNVLKARKLLEAFLVAVSSKIKQNGHIAIFWTMRNIDQCIEAVKKSKYTFRRVVSMYIPRGNARPYLGWLPRTQAIVIAQKYVPGQPTEFHHELSTYLNQKLNESEYSRSSLARILGCDSRLVMKWTRPGDPAWCLPTTRFYPRLKELLKLDDRYDILYERRDTTKDHRKDFEYKHDCYIVAEDRDGEMIHPAQKPISVVEHLVTCICPEGGIVLDGFCGSGTTAVAARNTGRNFVCFDISPEFCEIAKRRLDD